MSRLAEFRAAEKALQEQLAQLESLKNDAGLKKEIEFEEKLQGLMKTYGKSLRDIISILDPNPGKSGASVAAAPKQRRTDRNQRRQSPRPEGMERTVRRSHCRFLASRLMLSS